jgi:acyl carrier protein
MDKQLIEIFCRVLNLDETEINSEIAIGDVPNWDSLGHLNLITSIEEEFDVYFSNESIIELNSFGKIKDFLSNRSAH